MIADWAIKEKEERTFTKLFSSELEAISQHDRTKHIELVGEKREHYIFKQLSEGDILIAMEHVNFSKGFKKKSWGHYRWVNREGSRGWCTADWRNFYFKKPSLFGDYTLPIPEYEGMKIDPDYTSHRFT